jgi:4-methyl-5(b-hydroxyethyl)-thiazole monophosphate biosynthesis
MALRAASRNNAFLAAICAAPMVLGKRGYLNGKRAICFPGFEEHLIGATVAKERVVTDGNVITAAGMGVALDFGLALVSALKGEEAAISLRSAVLAD